jgi:pyruvate formate lyase activating enzyme
MEGIEMKEACLYEALKNDMVRCNLCNHFCVIEPGSRGKCGVRENSGGKLYTLVYDKVIARHMDPIEKKPLFHFLPGSSSYSIATPGCNFKCLFCQNADISQLNPDWRDIPGEKISPEEIVRQASSLGAASIAYTYTEPTVFFELACDTARLATPRGIKNVFVSNGFMTQACIDEIHPNLHAANIDLKAFTDKFYKEVCGGRLKPVLRTIEYMHSIGIWIEVTTLIIPGYNDSREELRDIARFIAGVDPGIPWHVSRFHPTYKLTSAPSTPLATVQMARDIGYEEGLQYVYSGNVGHDDGENTFCPKCKTRLIERYGFRVGAKKLDHSRCPQCGAEISGVWAD